VKTNCSRQKHQRKGRRTSITVHCLAETRWSISTRRLAGEVVCWKLQSVSWLAMMSQASTSCAEDLGRKRHKSVAKFLHQFCAE